ncbi:MAG: bacillithiol biosynthesis cysteine-adding enzyme BshC [Candidatus Xenobiia bacterium LiM19]
MPGSSIRIQFRDILRENRLFCDYIDGLEELRPFFSANPSCKGDYEDILKQVTARTYRRKELCDILLRQNQRWMGCRKHSGEKTFHNIERLREQNCLAVVTGQQTGLFGGPLYTLYKAITAIRLADDLEMKLSLPVVPVFWIESEDHDFEEATVITILDDKGVPQRIAYEPADRQEGLPVSSVIIKKEMAEALNRLDYALPRTEWKEALLELLRCSFREKTKYLDAFASFMHALLEDRGLILVTPSDAELKEMALPIFRNEIETAPAASRLVAESGEKLESLGMHAQISVKPGRVNLFYHDPKRRPIFFHDGAFSIDKTEPSKSLDEMLEMLQRDPSAFSPTVSLRPLMQDFLFPTLAYVAGPGEISYWAQLGGLYQHFGIPEPVVYPRMSLTILEEKHGRILEKYGVTPDEALQDQGRLIDGKISKSLPEDFIEKISQSRTSIEEIVRNLQQEAVAIDVNLEPAFRHFTGKLSSQWENLARKMQDAWMARDAVLTSQKERVRNSLFPEGALQERALNVTSFLVRYERALIERLFTEPSIAPPWNHQVIEL